jgi:demethylmenaquinone methyltransferase / 2-methoxy-6-polyprenyl-1,4-benzoquinol methylase
MVSLRNSLASHPGPAHEGDRDGHAARRWALSFLRRSARGWIAVERFALSNFMAQTSLKKSPLPGTRPEGARDEREAAAHVQRMFARIAPRYDLLNHLLSFSLDRLWRRRTARRFLHILRRPEARVLDLCCGTGDLAFALARARGGALHRACHVPSGTETALGAQADAPRAPLRAQPAEEENSRGGRITPEDRRRCFHAFPVVGCDFVEPMLTQAREKSAKAAPPESTVVAAADAIRLPFADASFDLVTTAFGFRNLANYEQGLREIARVLTPGGEVGILEFSEPGPGPLAAAFRFYFRHILPRIGAVISGDAGAYTYLPGSVAKFPSPARLAALMEQNGFGEIRVFSWNFGSVILHMARRTR